MVMSHLKLVSKFMFVYSPYNVNCHGDANLMFSKLCRITWPSGVHRTESVSAMGYSMSSGQCQTRNGEISLTIAVLEQGATRLPCTAEWRWLQRLFILKQKLGSRGIK